MSEQYSFPHAAESLLSLFQDLVGAPLNVSNALGDCSSLEYAIRLMGSMGFDFTFTDQFPPNVSGFIEVSDDYRLIVVNNRKHPAHQIATLAHEISHALLHVKETGLRTNLKEECEANLLAFLLIFRRFNSRQLKDLFRHNPDLVEAIFTALFAAVLGLAAMGLARLESWFQEWLRLKEECIVQKRQLSEQFLASKTTYFAPIRALGVTLGRRRRSNQKNLLNPFLAGCKAGIPVPCGLSGLQSLPGIPLLRHERRAKPSIRSRVLSKAVLIKDIT